MAATIDNADGILASSSSVKAIQTEVDDLVVQSRSVDATARDLGLQLQTKRRELLQAKQDLISQLIAKV